MANQKRRKRPGRKDMAPCRHDRLAILVGVITVRMADELPYY